MISVPLQIDEPDVTPDVLDDLYMLSASAPTGGMYPVGASGLWHGGVHLSIREGLPVKAPTGGRIVAARLSPEETVGENSSKKPALCAYGHTNFLLTEHTWPPSASEEEGTPYYMLFMHLKPMAIDPRLDPTGGTGPPWWCAAEEHLIQLTRDLNFREGPSTDHPTVFAGGRMLSAKRPLVPIGDAQGGDRTPYQWQEVVVRETGRRGYVATGPPDNPGGWTEPAGESGLSEATADRLRKGKVVNLDIPVGAGTVLWEKGMFGQDLGEWEDEFLELAAEALGYPEPIDRAPTLHWEVFSPEKAFGLEEEGEGGGDRQEGAGGPASTNGAQEGSSEEGASEEEGSPALSVPSWTAVEDATSPAFTLNPEESDAASLIKEKRQEAPELPDEEDYEALSMGEKRSIAFTETGKELRTCAVKYVSEWGLGETDIKDALQKSPAHSVEADKADFGAFQFWDKVEALPSDATVWHYHPVTTLQAIGAKHPWFYLEDGEAKQTVSTNEEVWEQAEGEGESVYVQDINKTWKLGDTGERSGNQGIGQDPEDSPNLYEMLREGRGGDSIPRNTLSDLQQRVWSSLSYIEGSLAAINTYDSAYLSVGPLQKTAGADFGDTTARGELFGVIDFLLNPSNYDGGDAFLSESERQTFREAFQRHFGNRLSFAQSAEITGVPKAHPEVDGTVLSAPDQKERFRNDLKWPYRFVKAYEDPEFREPVLRKGLGRLDTIMSQNLRFTVTVEGKEHTLEPELRDVFSRDLSQALLLGWHINYPSSVWEPHNEDWFDSLPPETLSGDTSPKRETYVIQKLEEWGVTSTEDLPLSRERELRLVVLLLRARMDSGMTDPAGRAGKILRYAPNDVIKEIVEMMGKTRRETESREAFIRRGLEEGLQDPRSDRNSTATGDRGWNGGRRPLDPDQDPVLTDFWEESGSV